MDGAIRPLAGGCLRDKRAPVEAAIETEEQVIAPFCEWKHNGRPQATAGIARPTMRASEPTTSTAPAWPSRTWLSPDRIRDGTNGADPVSRVEPTQSAAVCVESRQAYQALKSLAALRPANPIDRKSVV